MENLLDSTKRDQKDLRIRLWKIHNDKRNQSLSAFAFELGVATQTITSFFRGGNVSRIVERRLYRWLDRQDELITLIPKEELYDQDQSR